MQPLSNKPTTVSRLTSAAPSAIAVLQIDGPSALEYLRRLWRPNQGDSHLQMNAIRFGFTSIEGQASGESIVVCRTDEHQVEIHCHGGRLASEIILRTLISYGAIEQSTDPLGHTSEDMIFVEAREDLVQTTTLRTTSILLDQMRGALQREFDIIHAALYAGDFSDALTRLKQLEERANVGRHLIEPWQVVLAGPPNSGKSSLFNLLLGYSRAIVHEQAGTTRDLLSEQSSFDGWPIELIDGAGIRKANDGIEATGVERTLHRIASADCVLLLVDRTTGWTETHADILRHCVGKVVLVVTKSDLGQASLITNSDCLLDIPTNVSDSIATRVETSSVTGAGLKELIDAVVSSLVPMVLKAGDPIPFRERHRELIATLLGRSLLPRVTLLCKRH